MFCLELLYFVEKYSTRCSHLLSAWGTTYFQKNMRFIYLDKNYKDGPLNLIWDLDLANSFWDHVQ
jgi:hypothetical protein